MYKTVLSEKEQEIIRSGKHHKEELARMFNRDISTITTFIQRNNIHLDKWFPQGKILNNHDFFKTWTNDMAYVLGFLVADGWISLPAKYNRGYSVCLTLSMKDIDHLEKIKLLLGATCKNSYYSDNKGHEYVRIKISSKVAVQDLINLGVMPNKSLIIDWSEKWPEDFSSHIVRGIFDGDGSLFIRKNFTNSPNRLPQPTYNITGNYDLLQAIHFKYTSLLGKKRGCLIKSNRGNYSDLSISGRKSCDVFNQWIYQDSTDYNRMTRKYDRYKDYLLTSST